jgi:phospholipid transport system substrate-binding protein
MTKNRIYGALLMSVLIFASASLYASPTRTVQKFLWALSKYKHESSIASQKAMNAKIKKYCNFVLNTDYMGRQAMRDNWNRLTPPQRKEYMSLLTQIIQNIVYRDASRQLNDMRIKYKGAKMIAPGKYKVYADIYIISEALDMKAEYVLIKKGNFYKLIDIYFDGESIIEDYRVEFNRIIRQHGVSGRRQSLLNRMRSTLRKNVLDDARKKRRDKKKKKVRR